MGGMQMAVSCGRSELLSLRGRQGSLPVFAGIRVGQLFNFLCFVFLVCCLRPVSFVPNVASFSGLSVIDSHFDVL
jgi:hypothetical protein